MRDTALSQMPVKSCFEEGSGSIVQDYIPPSSSSYRNGYAERLGVVIYSIDTRLQDSECDELWGVRNSRS